MTFWQQKRLALQKLAEDLGNAGFYSLYSDFREIAETYPDEDLDTLLGIISFESSEKDKLNGA
jgi:hypothetical protein